MKTTTDIGNLIDRHQITMELRKVETSPIHHDAGSSDELDHFLCRLSKPGKEMRVFLTTHSDGDHLTIHDVLFLLAMDASGCKMFENYAKCAESFKSILMGSDGNIEEIEAFWREYRQRCRQVKELRGFLGENDYRELLRHFQFEEDFAEVFDITGYGHPG